jgi:hypothetical protein
LSLWIDKSLLLLIVLFSSSRTFCDDLLPLPHNLLKILRRFVSSSTVFEGEEEEEEGSTDVDDGSDKITAESIYKKQYELF